MSRRISLAEMWQAFGEKAFCGCLRPEEEKIWREIFYAGAISINWLMAQTQTLATEEERLEVFHMLQQELQFYLRKNPEEIYHGFYQPVQRPESGANDENTH